VRLNQSHPAQVTPSWYGDSVGHYEGDELVVDTVGLKIGPFSMVDWYGTPFTEAIHLMERYRLLDYDATMKAIARDAKENFQFVNPDNGLPADPGYRGKGLQIEVTVADEGAYTMPWSATVTLRRAVEEPQELVCADNTLWYPGKNSAVPRASNSHFGGARAIRGCDRLNRGSFGRFACGRESDSSCMWARWRTLYRHCGRPVGVCRTSGAGKTAITSWPISAWRRFRCFSCRARRSWPISGIWRTGTAMAARTARRCLG
jgi:hypothetical protein